MGRKQSAHVCREYTRPRIVAIVILFGNRLVEPVAKGVWPRHDQRQSEPRGPVAQLAFAITLLLQADLHLSDQTPNVDLD